MLAKHVRPTLGQRAGREQKQKYFRHRNNTTRKYSGSNFESRVKGWAVDRLAERLFQGRNSVQHRLAVAFWKKSGRRLSHA